MFSGQQPRGSKLVSENEGKKIQWTRYSPNEGRGLVCHLAARREDAEETAFLKKLAQ